MSLPPLLTRQAKIAGIGTATLLSLLALQTAPERELDSTHSGAPLSRALPDSLVVPMSYGGIGAEGVDLIWRGTTLAPLAGQATVRMAYAGAPADRAMPIWPVTALLFFSADDYRSSFIAELSGTMDWQNGEMRVTGVVTDGAAVHARLEQVLRLESPGRSGRLTLHFPIQTAGQVATGPTAAD
jgi:hypothetical protein